MKWKQSEAAGLSRNWSVRYILSPLTAPHVDFWLMMTCSALALGGLSTWLNPGWWKRTQWSAVNILYGIILAAVLWGIFWTGGDF